MGQYYRIANIDKKEYLNPHTFGDGVKLMEFGSSGGAGTLCALAYLLKTTWKGNRIVICGDYANEGVFTKNPEDKGTNLYHELEEYKDVSKGVIKKLSKIPAYEKLLKLRGLVPWDERKKNSENDENSPLY